MVEGESILHNNKKESKKNKSMKNRNIIESMIESSMIFETRGDVAIWITDCAWHLIIKNVRYIYGLIVELRLVLINNTKST